MIYYNTFQSHDLFYIFQAMIYSTPLKPWSIPAPPESNIRDMAFDN